MRTIALLLLLGGLLLGPVYPALAWPGTGPATGTHCPLEGDARCDQGVRLTGRISGGELLLQWEGSAAPAFEIYYSSAPFRGYVPIDRTETTFYLEQLAHLDSTVINDFYRVQAVGEGQVSNSLGVFTFDLHG